MSPDVFDKAALIRLRLENARETLRDAHTLYEQDSSPKSIVNRAFQSRLEGDYQDYSKIDRKKATEILQSADDFVKSIEEKLSNPT